MWLHDYGMFSIMDKSTHGHIDAQRFLNGLEEYMMHDNSQTDNWQKSNSDDGDVQLQYIVYNLFSLKMC